MRIKECSIIVYGKTITPYIACSGVTEQAATKVLAIARGTMRATKASGKISYIVDSHVSHSLDFRNGKYTVRNPNFD